MNNTMIYRSIFTKGRTVYQSIFCDKIVDTTEKAVKWRISPVYTNGKEYFLWFPKSALIGEDIAGDPSYKLAKWFKMNDYTISMFERFGTVNV